MQRRINTHRILNFVGLISLILLLPLLFVSSGCNQSSTAQNEDTPTASKNDKTAPQKNDQLAERLPKNNNFDANNKPADKPAKKTEIKDPFLVPNGNATELLKYIEETNSLRFDYTKGNDDAFLAFQKKKKTAIFTAAARILKGKADLEQKLQALSIQTEVSEKDIVDENLREIKKLLNKDTSIDDQLAIHMYSNSVLSQLTKEEGYTEKELKRIENHASNILKALDITAKNKLNDEQETNIEKIKFGILSFLSTTDIKDSKKNFHKFAIQSFASKDKDFAFNAFQTVLNSRFMDDASGDDQAMMKIVGDFKAWFDVNKPSQYELGPAAQLIDIMLRTSDIKAALALRDLVIENYKNVKDKELKAGLEQFKKLASRHLDFIGKPVKIEGRTLEGKEFDLKKYQGKVVLIDFWATWCPPCVKLIPELKETYKKYHDRGFEVIGISLDTNDEKLEAYVENVKIPWEIVANMVGPKAVKVDPNAERYHADAIPLLLLVDQKGNIISLGTHGKKLEALLDKMLPKKKK